jgi:hypothetical protein
VTGVFSRNDILDTIPQALQRRPYFLSAGLYNGLIGGNTSYKAQAISYIEFRPSLFRQTGWELPRQSLQAQYNIDSVVLSVERFRVTVDSASRQVSQASASTFIDVFACGLQKDSTLLDTNSIGNKFGTDMVSLDSGAVDSVYSIRVDRLDTGFIPRIKSAVSAAGSDTSWFAFCLKGAPGSSGVARFYGPSYGSYAPQLHIYYRARADTLTEKSEIFPANGTNSYVSVFEPAFSPQSGNAAADPVSFSGTVRRAVMKLDVSSLKTFMDDSATSGKKFVIIQRADLSLKAAHSTTDLRRDSIQVLYNVSDTLATQQNSFKKVSSFYLINTGLDTTYVLPLATWLQPLIVNRKSTSVYLYLTIAAPGQPTSFAQVDWAHPDSMKLNAIFTNPR